MRAVVCAAVVLLAVQTQATAADPKPEAKTYYDRGFDWLKKREYDKAIAEFDEAIRLNPSYVEAYFDRGNAWSQKKDYDKAIAEFTEAIRLDPEKVFRDDKGNVRCGTYCALNNRGFAWEAKKEFDKAIGDFTEAIRLDPNNPEFYYRRGFVRLHKKEYDKALADFDEAVRLGPDDEYGLNCAAWLRATCPDDRFRDGKKAVELATEACRLTNWSNFAYLDTLAAACAEAGDFDSAIKHQAKALELKPGDTELQQHLGLYKDHKPYREE